MERNFMEEGPQLPSPENQEGNVDKLVRWRRELENVKGNFETQIDELGKKMGTAIAAVEESSLQEGKQDEVLKEVLESGMIMKEVDNIREEIKRLENVIAQIDKAIE